LTVNASPERDFFVLVAFYYLLFFSSMQ